MKNQIIKGSTLVMFVSLISVFIAYRSGYLSGQKSFFSVSPKGEVLMNFQNDSIPKMDSLKKNELLPSSKTLILKDAIMVSDSNKINFTNLIPSSKSGTIVIRDYLKKNEIDSIQIDTLKKHDRN